MSQTSPEPIALRYVPQPGLALLVLRNWALNLLTLYLYRFWAKTRWRRQVWGDAVLWGDSIEYAGSGLELFRGFLFAALAVFPILLFFGVSHELVEPGGFWSWIDYLGYYLALYALIVVAEFHSRRYRLARTLWRGIAFRQAAKFDEYARMHARLFWRVWLTLGWTAPRLMVGRKAWLIAHTRFGAARFQCAVEWRDAMPACRSVWWTAAAFVALWFYYWSLAGRGSPAATPIGWAVWLAATVLAWRYALYRVVEFRVLANATRLGAVGAVCRAESRPAIRAALVAGAIGVASVAAVLAVIVLAIVVFDAADRYDAFWYLMFYLGVLGVFGALGFARDAWLVPMLLRGLIEATELTAADALLSLPAERDDDAAGGEGLADSFDAGLG